jgi:hypothetical protein
VGNAGNAGSAGSAGKTGIVGSDGSSGGGGANDTGEAADNTFAIAAGDEDEVDAGLAAAGDENAGKNGNDDREGSDGSGGSGSAGNDGVVTELLVLSDRDANLATRSDGGYRQIRWAKNRQSSESHEKARRGKHQETGTETQTAAGLQ